MGILKSPRCVLVGPSVLTLETTDFYTTGYERCIVGGRSNAVYFNFLQSVITWRTSELAWLEGRLLLGTEIMFGNKSWENMLLYSGNMFVKCHERRRWLYEHFL